MTTRDERAVADLLRTVNGMPAKREQNGWEVLGKLGAFVGIMALNIGYYAFVITKLWAWFVMPAFPVAVLSLRTAVGIDLFFTLMLIGVKADDPTAADKDLGELLGAGLKRIALYPSFVLLIAWCIHLIAG